MSCKAVSLARTGACGLILVLLGGCPYLPRELEPLKSQLEIVKIQSRTFDTADRDKALRTIIAVLQDLGFVIDTGDYALGSVTGLKVDDYLLKMTVTVRPHGTSKLLVRADARYHVTPIFDSGPYQQFFSALARAMFLEARQAD